MVSAVPAGEVIALDDVFGMVSPNAATIGTIIKVVRFPGKPPTQCLSTTTFSSQVILLPVLIIDCVKSTTSSRLSRLPAQAVIKDER